MKNGFNSHIFISLIICFIFIISLQHSAFAYFLPDTGQTTCYSDRGKNVSCPAPGQSLAQDGTYTINPSSFTVKGNGTVFDNNTWLVWQREDDSITRTWKEAEDYCEALTIDGYTDWRLPSKKELESIVKYNGLNPGIDPTAFLNTKSADYWSSTIYPTCVSPAGWYINFGDGIIFSDNCTRVKDKGGWAIARFEGGNVNFDDLTRRRYARCVRGGSLATGAYSDNGNGTVTDSKTGLTWQQQETSPMKWTSALGYCEGLSLGGYTDWRLPNQRELLSLVDDTRQYPSIDSQFFPNVKFDSVCDDAQTVFYWTSTTNPFNINNALTTSFERGFSTSLPKSDSSLYARCVRGNGQSFLLDAAEISLNTDELDFWYLESGETRTMTITITNAGGNDLVIGQISTLSPPFSVASDGCSGGLINPAETCSVDVAFHSLSEGTFTEILYIPSSDADNSIATVNLSGNVNTTGGKILLPDTRQTNCYNQDDSAISCPLPGNTLAQDGTYTANAPSYGTNEDETALDKRTRLVWQRADDGIKRSWSDAKGYCENLELGGYADWRLPTKLEISGIVDYGRSDPSIDKSVFQGAKTDVYWTSSEQTSDTAWHIFFGKTVSDDRCGYDLYEFSSRYEGVSVLYGDKSSQYYTRCVRGDLPSTYFMDNGDGTVSDKSTGLLWQKGESAYKSWYTALSDCEGLSLAGHSDWRLPNVKELQSLMDGSGYIQVFSDPLLCSSPKSYWSSTSMDKRECSLFWIYQNAYYVYSQGAVSWDKKPSVNSYSARCVRGGNVPAREISMNRSSMVFGYTELGSYQSSNLIISNIGTGDLVIGQITGPSQPFSILSDNCSGTTLSGSASCSVEVRFSPTVAGNFSDTLAIQSDDADNPGVTLSLTGYGAAPTAALRGNITDASTTLALSNVTVTVTDPFRTQSALTNGYGAYTVNGVAQGNYTATYQKPGYIGQTRTGSISSGQTLTQYVQLTPASPLILSVSSPQDGASFTSSPVTVTGAVTNNANVTVNGVQAEINGGVWTVSVPLSEGQNLITANASDQYGQTASRSININLITKGAITGTVTDSSIGLPLASAAVSITDAANNVLTASTGVDGRYTVSSVSSGPFAGTITKGGYTTYNVSETISPGQTIIVNASLSPVLPVISGILVDNVTTDSATITWTTDQPSNSLVEFGMTTTYGSSASDSALTTTRSITLIGLTPSTIYHFRVKSTNGYGFSSYSSDNIFTTQSPPSPITLAITSPIEGATIKRPDILVKGTVTNSTGKETGVVVNGIVASVYGNQFVANHVPLTEGANTVTVTATDTAGNTATAAMPVNAETTGNYISISSNIESGISPLEVTLRLDGSFSITSSNLNVLGPVLPEVLFTSADEYQLRFTAEGTYFVTASVTGPDGYVYEDMLAITVMNKDLLDALLTAKWDGMKGALLAGAIEESLSYFVEGSTERYRQVFSDVGSARINSILSGVTALRFNTTYGSVAQYWALRTESDGTFAYPITFFQDANGIWKIMGF